LNDYKTNRQPHKRSNKIAVDGITGLPNVLSPGPWQAFFSCALWQMTKWLCNWGAREKKY